MRRLIPLLLVTAIACSDDPTGPSGPQVEITVAEEQFYNGQSYTATIQNRSSDALTFRDLGCGTQVERQVGSSWVSMHSAGDNCSFYTLAPNEPMEVFFNLPVAPAGTYRVATLVRQGDSEQMAHSSSFTVTAPPASD